MVLLATAGAVLLDSLRLLYLDILRTRHVRTALCGVAALLSLVEPFILAWAHFYQHRFGWIALCLVFALWLLHHAERRRSWQAGSGGRPGYRVRGAGALELRAGGGRDRLLVAVRNAGATPPPLVQLRIALFGANAILCCIPLLVFVVVQLPANGCLEYQLYLTGHNMLEKVIDDKFELLASHGPHSERLLRLGNLPPLIEDRTPSGFHHMVQFHICHYGKCQGAGPTKRNVTSFIQQESDGTDKESTQSLL